MQKSFWLFASLLFITCVCTTCKKVGYLSVGFYNVENLFDTIDDPSTFDGQYLPDSSLGWNTDKYNTKLQNLAKVISSFHEGHPPVFLGLCEIENRKVVEDLVAQPLLKEQHYRVVHVESKDARGIDVAAVYNPDMLSLISYGVKPVDLSEFEEVTRDVLWVKMKSTYNGETFYFLVNHWPSRRGGLEKSEPKRAMAARSLRELTDSLLTADTKANLIVMGDFNDEPTNKSITEVLGAQSAPTEISNTQLFNAMAPLKEQGKGSYCFRGNWNMLDQIMISSALVDDEEWSYREASAQIMDHNWMRQADGNYKDYPLRTFGGRKYLAGYSDHFPVSIILEHH